MYVINKVIITYMLNGFALLGSPEFGLGTYTGPSPDGLPNTGFVFGRSSGLMVGLSSGLCGRVFSGLSGRVFSGRRFSGRVVTGLDCVDTGLDVGRTVSSDSLGLWFTGCGLSTSG